MPGSLEPCGQVPSPQVQDTVYAHREVSGKTKVSLSNLALPCEGVSRIHCISPSQVGIAQVRGQCLTQRNKSATLGAGQTFRWL